MCGRKKSYETQKKANKIGKKHNQRSYLCPVCYCWHLTKTPYETIKESITNGK
jgi:hypothetical protein